MRATKLINRGNFEAFATPAFRLYFLGNVFALHAMWIQRIAVAWMAWDLAGTASFVGWIAFLGFVPTFVTGPVFGALIDRVRLKRAATFSQGALSVLAFSMAVLYSIGAVTPLVLSILALAGGIATSAHHPVRMSLAPQMAARSAIGSVVTAGSLNFNLARSLGPALGGLMIAGMGMAPTLWVIFALTLPFQAIIPFLSPRPRSISQPPDASVWQGLRAGFRHAWRTRFIRTVLMLTAVFAFLGRGLPELLPLIADGIFARGAAGLGILTSAAGMGALAAAALITLLPQTPEGRLPRAGLIAAFTGLGAALVVAFSTIWLLTVAATALLGASGTLVGVNMQTAVHRVLPDDLRGRVMSLWVMTGVGASAVGALVLGGLADWTGIATGTALLGGACAGLLLVILRSYRPVGGG